MRRYLEYGVLSSALLMFVYLVITFLSGVPITISAIGLCAVGGIVSGIFIAVVLYHFSSGKVIPEGEEDNYINKK